MMCLGWNTRAKCAARPDVTLEQPQSTCPDISWFWGLAAAIGLGFLVKGTDKRGGAA